ncbi:MAG: bifunctional diaminohydroxyphosphoribosylaminopyrimidine deaminase/5-amino-6-(5-phosphoribosylamino)uracil reductase RibD [Owenweeksia sp.]
MQKPNNSFVLKAYFCGMEHQPYMQRCLQLAENGVGTTSPNPMVGSVIVHNNQIIGEGWHRKAGEPHAEVMAIRSVKNKDLLRESTLYVNLEPCAHHGRTPPCSDLIIENNIARVVIGSRDPFDEVNGKGIAKMQAKGIEIIENILPDECRDLNKRFFTFHNKKRPYILLKWAQSSDGFMDKIRTAGETGPNWITGKEAKMLVHKWRSEEDAILVGAGTVANDNPSLTVREVSGKNPVRLLIDPSLRTEKNKNILDQSVPTVVFNRLKEGPDGNIQYVQITDDTPLLPALLEYCYEAGITSILVEGGACTLQQFIGTNLWDEARIWTGNEPFLNGLKSPEIKGVVGNRSTFGSDRLQILYNK